MVIIPNMKPDFSETQSVSILIIGKVPEKVSFLFILTLRTHYLPHTRPDIKVNDMKQTHGAHCPKRRTQASAPLESRRLNAGMDLHQGRCESSGGRRGWGCVRARGNFRRWCPIWFAVGEGISYSSCSGLLFSPFYRQPLITKFLSFLHSVLRTHTVWGF